MVTNTRVFVVVEMFQGVITDVSAFLEERRAIQYWEEIVDSPGLSWREYATRLASGDSPEETLDKDIAGTTIYEVTLNE